MSVPFILRVGRYEWSVDVEAHNIAINGITFTEAVSALEDIHAVYYTFVEDSFIVGRSFRQTILVVGFAVPYAGRTRIEVAAIATPAQVADDRRRLGAG